MRSQQSIAPASAAMAGGAMSRPFEALVVPLGVVVSDVFSDGCAEMALAEQHELVDGPAG